MRFLFLHKLFNFFKEVKLEIFEKTVWPSRDEVLNVTVAVISSLVIVSILLYFVDKLSGAALRWAVVDNVNLMKSYISEFTVFVFIFFVTFLFYFFSKWSKK